MTTRPDLDQIELSFFGPGYGECCVIHMGAGQWAIVDSCVDIDTGEPVALQYLSSLGVNYRRDVKIVIATHWHDDHVRGLSSIVRHCENAQFCTSSALTTTEFLAIAHLYANKPSIKSSSGVSEMHSIIGYLKDHALSPPKKAIPDRRVFMLDAGESGHGFGCEIWTLSPSDAQVNQFLIDISALIPGVLRGKKRATMRNPNHMSVVAWIKFGQIAVLLGADLEESANTELGWSPIVCSTCRPLGSVASVFKIPHHGSANGHSDDVWRTMVQANSFAVVTPYANGRTKLPTKEDVNRIRKRTPEGFITNSSRPSKVPRRPPAVQKMINATVKSISVAEPRTGVVRFRNGGRADPQNWVVWALNGACRLGEL
jgi:beta-lactamase superfamily II metal-dependent hydrolase